MCRARIVCTLGPATSSCERIERLARAGMDVARLNFSHGSFEAHEIAIQRVREIGQRLGAPIAIMQDLPGPKIRLGVVKNGRVTLRNKAVIEIAVSSDEGTAERLTTGYPSLYAEIREGQRLLLADGMVELRVRAVREDAIECGVVKGGTLTSHKGLNFASAGSHGSALTAHDRDCVRFGLERGVDFVAQSFVRNASDVRALREFMQSLGACVPIVAKLEKPQAMRHLNEILEATDFAMVARGDLGVEVSPAEVPLLQKHILREARQRGVPTIVATQMLESMTHSPRPTRAEASDVANAILDGADAVMLSEETAVGEYPVETVAMMAQICEVAERQLPEPAANRSNASSRAQVICGAACQAANRLRAKFLIAFTETGTTARLLSQFRPQRTILAFTPHGEIRRRMSLLWGVQSRQLPPMPSTDAMIAAVDGELLKSKAVRPGDLLVIVCGAPVGQRDSTNLMKLHRVGAKDLG